MIYDCFTFFNELEMLDLRLNMLKDAVDFHVLVEADTTFSGKPKPLYYAEHKQDFAAFNHKILHVVVDDMPASSDPWVLERFQRNAVTRGLRGADPDAYMILSDLDEFPNPGKIQALSEPGYHHLASCLRQGMLVFSQRMHLYYVNWVMAQVFWNGSVIVKIRNMPSPQEMRDLGVGARLPAIANAGWHFSYFGGHSAIQNKLESFSHCHDLPVKKILDNPTSPEEIQRQVRDGKFLFRDISAAFTSYEEDLAYFKTENLVKRIPSLREWLEKYPRHAVDAEGGDAPGDVRSLSV